MGTHIRRIKSGGGCFEHVQRVLIFTAKVICVAFCHNKVAYEHEGFDLR